MTISGHQTNYKKVFSVWLVAWWASSIWHSLPLQFLHGSRIIGQLSGLSLSFRDFHCAMITLYWEYAGHLCGAYNDDIQKSHIATALIEGSLKNTLLLLPSSSDPLLFHSVWCPAWRQYSYIYLKPEKMSGSNWNWNPPRGPMTLCPDISIWDHRAFGCHIQPQNVSFKNSWNEDSLCCPPVSH